MHQLRIFSYLPNPRLWKATIAARLTNVEIEVRGTSPRELANWCWDFAARPLTTAEQKQTANQQLGTVGFAGKRLHKTAAFLETHPFGTVPAAFSPDGKIGIFESNSILRAVARLGQERLALYGGDLYEAARIDSFLDASLVFGRDVQPYLLALLGAVVPVESHARAAAAFRTYLGGIEQALLPARENLVGSALSIADICFVCELTMMWYEKPKFRELAAAGLPPIAADIASSFPRAARHFATLREHPAFAPDLAPHLAKLEARTVVMDV